MKTGGFIDLQVNGYLGIDFTSPSLEVEEIRRVAESLASAGTEGFCATLITSPMEVYRRNLPIIARAMEDPGIRGRLLGIHLEGPFISPAEGARGAHSAALTRRPDPDEFDRMQAWALGHVALLTLAPEIEGALPLIEHVRSRHPTTLCLGHHLAPRQVIKDAVRAGATVITHLGNGCPNALPRHDNVLIHQLAEPGLAAGLITDGHHLPEDFIRIAFACKKADRIFIVSDSAPIAGLAPGVYETLGNRVRLTEAGRVESLDGPHLAGSGFNLAACVRHLESLNFLSAEDIWKVSHDNPLRILGRM